MRLDKTEILAIATSFVQARQAYDGVSNYPGAVPQTLEDAYAIQDQAISMWPEKVAGWKVGGIGGQFAKDLGETKLTGPIFENQIYRGTDQRHDMAVFEKGFAAVEGEIVFIINKDAPADKTDWTIEDCKTMIGAAHIGVELASSPFSKINDLGPLVTISDFGNNNGLIIGDALKNWQAFPTSEWIVETIIDGESLGVVSSADVGGPFKSLQYCLNNAAQRGMPIKKGMAISTGAITGVHRAFAGQKSTVKCKGTANIDMQLVAGG